MAADTSWIPADIGVAADAAAPPETTVPAPIAAEDITRLAPGMPAGGGRAPPAEGGFLTRSMRSVKDFISGDDRYGDNQPPALLDNLDALLAARGRDPGADYSAILDSAAPLAHAYALNGRPDQLAPAALAALPGAVHNPNGDDPNVVHYDGKDYLLRKPGLFTSENLAGLIGTGVIGAGTAVGVGAAAPAVMAARGFVPMLARAAAQGSGQVAATLGTGLALHQITGGSGADIPELIGAGAFGALGEVAGTVASGLWRTWSGAGRFMKSGAGADLHPDTPLTRDMLTTSGQRILAKEGQPAASLTVGQARQIDGALNNAADYVAAQPARGDAPAASAMAIASARQGVPLTVGQLSADPTSQFAENVLAKGPARDVMAGAYSDQRQAFLDAARRASGTDLSEEDLGNQLGDSIRQRAGWHDQQERAAWQPIDDRPRLGGAPDPDLYFHPDVAANLLDRLQQQAGPRSLYPEGTPAALRAHDVLGGMLVDHGALEDLTRPQAARMAGEAIRGGPPVNRQVPAGVFSLDQLQTTRRQLGSLINSAANDEDRAAVTQMRMSLDNATRDAINNGQVSGAPELMDQWRNALAASRAKHEFLGNDDPVAGFMRPIADGDMQGQQIYDALWGRGGVDGGSQTRQLLDHLQTQFRPWDDVTANLRSSYTSNVLTGRSGSRMEVNPQRFIDRVTNATDGRGQAITRQIPNLPQQDMADLVTLQRGLQAAQSPNPSGTRTTELANAAASVVRRIPGARAFLPTKEQSARDAAELATGARYGGPRLTPGAFGTDPRLGGPRLPVGATIGGLLGQYNADR